MSLIQAKRLQQAAFEMAASQNRNAGSGGGSGFVAMQFLGQASDSAADTITTTTYTMVPGVTKAFSLGRAGVVFISVWSFAKLSGAAGTAAFMHRFLDGNDYGPVGAWDKNNPGYTSSSFFTPIDTTGLTLGPGNHTVDLRVAVDNIALTWLNSITALQVYMAS